MEINKWLRYFILGGIAFIPFVPLIVLNNTFFPFITGKNFTFRIVVECIFAAWILLAYRDKKFRPQGSYILWSVLALAVTAGLATIFGLNPYKSFWSNFERMDGYITTLHLLAYFVVLISVLKKEVLWSYLVNFSLIANVFVLAISLRQLFGYSEIYQSANRLEASFGNAAYLAVYVLVYFFLLFYLFLKNVSFKKGYESYWPFAYLFLAFLNLIVLYYTATRGALLGVFGGLTLVSLSYAIFAKNYRLKWSTRALLVGLIVLGAVFWFSRDASFIRESQVLSRLASISLQDGTTKSRLMIWEMSWQGFKERPILGWGPENYVLVFDKYYNPEMYGQEPWFDRSHNIFFDWLINAGLLGLLAYLSIYLSTLYYLWRLYFSSEIKTKDTTLILPAVLTGLLGAYFFHNIFVFDNLVSYILFFSLIAYVHILTVSLTERVEEKTFAVKKDYKNKIKKETVDNQEIIFGVLVTVVGVALSFSLYYFNYKPMSVSLDLISALRLPSEQSAKTLEIFKNIFSKNTFGSGETREQLISRAFSVYGSAQIEDSLKFAYAKVIDEEIPNHLDTYGAEARPNLVFGSYYSALGRHEEGLKFLKKAQELSPKKQHILFELGSAFARFADGNSALTVLKQAYDLAPENVDARKMYALILLMTNRKSEALDLIAPIREDKSFFADDRFLKIFEEMGDQEIVNEILAKREKLTEENKK